MTGSCSAGYFCKQSATTPTPMILDPNGYFGPCPAGYYCPANTPDPVPCPIGYFSTQTLAIADTTCIKCPEGQYCSSTGLSAPTAKCDVGYYCPEGSTSSTGITVTDSTVKPCPIATYCPLGTASPISCPTGYYQESTAQGKCNICPKGYFCTGGTKYQCNAGYNCP